MFDCLVDGSIVLLPDSSQRNTRVCSPFCDFNLIASGFVIDTVQVLTCFPRVVLSVGPFGTKLVCAIFFYLATQYFFSALGMSYTKLELRSCNAYFAVAIFTLELLFPCQFLRRSAFVLHSVHLQRMAAKWTQALRVKAKVRASFSTRMHASANHSRVLAWWLELLGQHIHVHQSVDNQPSFTAVHATRSDAHIRLVLQVHLYTRPATHRPMLTVHLTRKGSELSITK